MAQQLGPLTLHDTLDSAYQQMNAVACMIADRVAEGHEVDPFYVAEYARHRTTYRQGLQALEARRAARATGKEA